MKNFFKTTFYVAVFIISGIGFQIACSNSDEISSNSSSTNKIVYLKMDNVGFKFYTCNFDGSNETEIPVVIPPNVSVLANGSNPFLSSDGQKLFFQGGDSSGNKIYSCNIDGSDFQEIVSHQGAIELGNAN